VRTERDGRQLRPIRPDDHLLGGSLGLGVQRPSAGQRDLLVCAAERPPGEDDARRAGVDEELRAPCAAGVHDVLRAVDVDGLELPARPAE
jgi:hypothetical protein